MLRLWNAFDDLARLEPWFAPSFMTGRGAQFTPAVDIEEHEDAYVVTADLPGVKPEEVDVQLTDGVLTISGERRSEKKTEKKGFTRVETNYGSFSRSFVLPTLVDSEHIDAHMKEGVLTVRLPKSEQARSRRIEIQSKAPELSGGRQAAAE